MKQFQLSTGVLLSLLAFSSWADGGPGDWRRNGSAEEKITRLVRTLPGAANIMIEMGERYKNLYAAAKRGKWEFALYQTEEMEGLIKKLQITRPRRAGTAQDFLDTVYPAISDAARSGDWRRFERAFEGMRQRCMECHAKNDHGFITLSVPHGAPSPVLDME